MQKEELALIRKSDLPIIKKLHLIAALWKQDRSSNLDLFWKKNKLPNSLREIFIHFFWKTPSIKSKTAFWGYLRPIPDTKSIRKTPKREFKEAIIYTTKQGLQKNRKGAQDIKKKSTGTTRLYTVNDASTQEKTDSDLEFNKLLNAFWETHNAT